MFVCLRTVQIVEAFKIGTEHRSEIDYMSAYTQIIDVRMNIGRPELSLGHSNE